MNARQHPGFTAIPKLVYAALEQGEISLMQFVILALMRQWADHRTGRVDSFSAERILRFLGKPKPSGSELRDIQRQVSRLKKMKWFRDDYQKGSKRPYHLWLTNHIVNILDGNAVVDPGADSAADDGMINRCEIISCHEISEPNDADDIAGKRERLSSSNQEGNESQSHDQFKGQKPKAPAAPDPHEQQARDLLTFIWNNWQLTRPHKWARQIVQKYPLLEIEYALCEFMTCHISDRARGFFFKDHQEDTLIDARRKRHGQNPCVVEPIGWDELDFSPGEQSGDTLSNKRASHN